MIFYIYIYKYNFSSYSFATLGKNNCQCQCQKMIEKMCSFVWSFKKLYITLRYFSL